MAEQVCEGCGATRTVKSKLLDVTWPGTRDESKGVWSAQLCNAEVCHRAFIEKMRESKVIVTRIYDA